MWWLSKTNASTSSRLLLDKFALIDRPRLAEHARSAHIDIVHRQLIAAQAHLREAVAPDDEVLIVRIEALVDEFDRKVMQRRLGRQLDRHAAMADAASVRGDAAFDFRFFIDREAVFVPPQPKDRAGEKFSQLLRRLWIAMIEARDILMMTEDHDPARIVGARLDDRPQPFDQFRRQRAVGLEEMFED